MCLLEKTETTKDDRFYRVVQRRCSPKKDVHDTLNTEDLNEMFLKQIEFCEKGEIMLRPKGKTHLEKTLLNERLQTTFGLFMKK